MKHSCVIIWATIYLHLHNFVLYAYMHIIYIILDMILHNFRFRGSPTCYDWPTECSGLSFARGRYSNVLGCFERAAKKGGFLTNLHPRWVAHLKAEHPRWVPVFEFRKADEN